MFVTEEMPPSAAGRGQQQMSQDQTIEWLLQRSQRRNRTVPLRRSLVQIAAEDGPRSASTPGPLVKLMRNEPALDLLLLVHAVTAGGDFGVTERSETWARATGVSFMTDGSASAPISRLWLKLERLHLITRSQDGRKTRVTKLLEDGTKRPYTRPAASTNGPLGEIYFQLPFQYWEEGFHRKLNIVGKATMLIAMSLRKAQFALPQTTEFAGYYGISKSTLERGIRELITTGLLEEVGSETYKTGETRTGYGERALYGFRPPFNLNVRKPLTKTQAPKYQAKYTTKESDSETPTLKLGVPSAPLPGHLRMRLRGGDRHEEAQDGVA